MNPARVATGVVAVEGLAGVVTGVGFVVAALVGHPDSRGTAVFLGVLLALYGAAVVLVARGIWRGRPWARTPAYLIQFFALVVAWYQRGTILAVTVALAVLAVVAIVSLTAAARSD